MTFHRLAATPDTVQVGASDAAIPPVLTVDPGDTVEIETVNGARSTLSREEAYQLCSLAVDFRVTQTVNGEKGVHGMLRKGLVF